MDDERFILSFPCQLAQSVVLADADDEVNQLLHVGLVHLRQAVVVLRLELRVDHVEDIVHFYLHGVGGSHCLHLVVVQEDVLQLSPGAASR